MKNYLSMIKKKKTWYLLSNPNPSDYLFAFHNNNIYNSVKSKGSN